MASASPVNITGGGLEFEQLDDRQATRERDEEAVLARQLERARANGVTLRRKRRAERHEGFHDKPDAVVGERVLLRERAVDAREKRLGRFDAAVAHSRRARHVVVVGAVVLVELLDEMELERVVLALAWRGREPR